MAGYAQPEDRMSAHIGEILGMGKCPENYKDEWKKYYKVDDPGDDNHSANWTALAQGIGCLLGNVDAIKELEQTLSNVNKFAQGEGMTDDGHFKLWLTGRYAAMVALENIRPDLYKRLYAETRQAWAMRVLCSTNYGKQDNLFVPPGNRWTNGKHGPWHPEYMWYRGLGMSHAAIRAFDKQLASSAEKIQDFQGPMNTERLCDKVGQYLRNDVMTIDSEYRSSPLNMSKYIINGTRGELNFVLLKNGYVAWMPKPFGPHPPRWVAACVDHHLSMVPDMETGRNVRTGGVSETMSDIVTLDITDNGTKSRYSFRMDDIIMWVTTGPNGVSVYLGEAETPDEVTPDEPVVTPPKKKLNWWEEFVQWLRELL